MSTMQAPNSDILATILHTARGRGPLSAAVVAPTAAERHGHHIDPSAIRDAALGDEAA
jgi:hypothetical protein